MTKIGVEEKVTINTGGLAGAQEINRQDLVDFQQGYLVTDDLGETANIPGQPLSKGDKRTIMFTTKCPFTIFHKKNKEIVNQDTRLILWRLGRIMHRKPLGPGTVAYFPDIDKFDKVKIQLDTFQLHNLDFITLDMVAITASFLVTFIINDPIKALINVKDYKTAMVLVVRSKLRDMIGAHDYEHLVKSDKKDEMDKKALNKINAQTFHWGIRVDGISRTDLKKKVVINYVMPVPVFNPAASMFNPAAPVQPSTSKPQVIKTKKTEVIDGKVVVTNSEVEIS